MQGIPSDFPRGGDVSGLQVKLRYSSSFSAWQWVSYEAKAPDERYGTATGMRNVLINGNFNIWQRGTSFTTAGYGPDRWQLFAIGTCTHSQETSIVPSGASYALKWTTGASSSYGQARQYIEQFDVIPLRGQILTVSAYVRVSAGFSGSMVFEIGSNTSVDTQVGGSWVQLTVDTSGTTSSSSYTLLKATFTVPSNAVGLYVGLVPSIPQGSGVTAYQSLVQLEPGSAATTFERRPYGQELALCQRYYQWVPFNSRFYSPAPSAVVESPVIWPVVMRATPTIGAIVVDPLAPIVIGYNNASNQPPSFQRATPSGGVCALGSSAAGETYAFGFRQSLSAEL